MKGLKIVATGRQVPTQIMTNDMLSQIVETNDEWIYSRTGMKERHFCEEETNISLASDAAKKALAKANIDKNDIGALVVATFSGDYFVPSTACLVQKTLELPDDMICYDLNAACSGFLFGLETVRGLLLQSEKKYAILIGSEVISKKLDMTDRGTCILFGDGAGAVVLTLDEEKNYTSIMGSHGDEELIFCPSGEETNRKVHMDGQGTYKFAVRTVPKLMKNVAAKADVDLNDISLFILHQANERIIDAVAKFLNLPKERFFVNIAKYGNTSAASVAMALDDAMEQNLCKSGDKVMLVGFGAGRTWGAVVMDI